MVFLAVVKGRGGGLDGSLVLAPPSHPLDVGLGGSLSDYRPRLLNSLSPGDGPEELRDDSIILVDARRLTTAHLHCVQASCTSRWLANKFA